MAKPYLPAESQEDIVCPHHHHLLPSHSPTQSALASHGPGETSSCQDPSEPLIADSAVTSHISADHSLFPERNSLCAQLLPSGSTDQGSPSASLAILCFLWWVLLFPTSDH